MIQEFNRFGKVVKLDPFLANKLDHLGKRLNKDHDNVIMIDGMEGTGKSTGIAFPVAWYLNGAFDVVFTPEQFEKAFDKAKPGETIVWDEFVLAGLSTQALSKMQEVVIKKLTTGRKKNLNLVLVVPNYFMFRDYFSCHRSLILLHTYSPDFLTRGYYAYYDYDTKQYMYHKYKKVKIHNISRANHRGNFVATPKGYYIDEKYYQDKKDEAILQIGKDKEKKPNKFEELYRNIVLGVILKYRDLGYTWQETADFMKMKVRSAQELTRRYKYTPPEQ